MIELAVVFGLLSGLLFAITVYLLVPRRRRQR